MYIVLYGKENLLRNKRIPSVSLSEIIFVRLMNRIDTEYLVPLDRLLLLMK